MSSTGPNPNPSADASSDKREEVHFFPGAKTLLYFVNGEVKLRAEAWGGPQQRRRDPGDTMDRTPTTPGTFIIDCIEPYQTSTWPFSQLRWGTRIRRSQSRPDKVEYERSPGKWRSLERDFGWRGAKVDAKALKALNKATYDNDVFPERWVFNDFGPRAVRYYRDRNSNGRRDRSERLEGEMIHTSPGIGEEIRDKDPGRAYALQLTESHGCIHIRPIDRDMLVDAGAFRRGMTLVIHRYDEFYGIDQKGWP